MAFDPNVHYELDNNQVDALITAIEASPMVAKSNGETSEVVIKAALYLTGDNPDGRESEFIDTLAEVTDVDLIKSELSLFENIAEEFENSTENETAPQVLQTKMRLDRIIEVLRKSLRSNAEAKRKTVLQKLTQSKSTSLSKKKLPLAEQVDEKPDEKVEACTTGICESNWFRFAAFAIVAVLLLIAVVVIVQWLRAKHEAETVAKPVANAPSAILTDEIL